MNTRHIFIFLILFNIISSEFLNKNSLIYSPLFHQENFGKIRKIYYQNENQNSNLILASKDSISSVNLSKKEINYRKKINPLDDIISLEPKNFFMTQPKTTSVQIYRTETGQFVNSLDIISKDNLLYDVKTIKIKEYTLTIFVSFKAIIMQSKKKIIFEKNFSKEEAEDEANKVEKKMIRLFFDLHVDEENQFISYGLLVNGKIKVYKITFDSLYKTISYKMKLDEDDEESDNDSDEDSENRPKKKKIEKVEIQEEEIFSYEVKHNVAKGFLTKDILYIYDGRSVYGYNITGKKMEMFSLVEKYMIWDIWSFYNSNSLLVKGQKYFYYFLNGEISFQFDTKSHIGCSMSNLPSPRIYCYLEEETSDKNLVAYYPNNDGKLEREFYTINSLFNIYTDANTLDRVRLIEANPFNNRLFTIVTTNRIIEFKINDDKSVEIVNEMENNYEKYITSELFIYKQETSNNNEIFDSFSQYQNYYTTINSMKGNVNLFKILKTMCQIIINDIKEIANSLYKCFFDLKNLINNLIEKKAFDIGKETSNKSNEAFLFLVTENNLFKVLDAYTGKILFLQQLPRAQKIRIIKDDTNTNQRYVNILFGKKNLLVYDLKYNKFINDVSSIMHKLDLKDDLLINEERLNMIMKSFLSLIKENPVYDLTRYQLDEKVFGPNKEKIALYVDYEKSALYIMKFYINKNKEQKLIMLHNFNFGKLISISNPKIPEDISQHHLSEGKIFYKFINNNIYYILSSETKEIKTDENESKKKTKERLILTILDGKNGKILEEKILENVDISSVRYLFDQNYGLISYTKINKGFKRNEILSFEIMNKNVDYSLVRLLKNKIFNQNQSKKVKEENNNENEIEIISKTYITERSIKCLSLSKSKYNKGNKYVLMLFESNDLQLIKREELSPRRPNMIKIKGKATFDPENNSIYADKELPGYNPVITLNPNNKFINKDKIDVYDIKTIEGDNESTFITCIIGVNVECTEMYPDKLYDRLSPKFKKELLVAVTFGFIVFIFFFRRYHIKTEFKKAFLGEINNKN